jgi:chromosome segregation ATPase
MLKCLKLAVLLLQRKDKKIIHLEEELSSVKGKYNKLKIQNDDILSKHKLAQEEGMKTKDEMKAIEEKMMIQRYQQSAEKKKLIDKDREISELQGQIDEINQFKEEKATYEKRVNELQKLQTALKKDYESIYYKEKCRLVTRQVRSSFPSKY